MEIDFWKPDGPQYVADGINDLSKRDAREAKKVRRKLDKLKDCPFRDLMKSEIVKRIHHRKYTYYELRSGFWRITFYIRDQTCWLIHIFTKKREDTPQKDLKTTEDRIEDLIEILGI